MCLPHVCVNTCVLVCVCVYILLHSVTPTCMCQHTCPINVLYSNPILLCRVRVCVCVCVCVCFLGHIWDIYAKYVMRDRDKQNIP
jgi:hypothetical protein